VLIASPSDVPDERQAVAQAIYDWNALHSVEQGKVLLPVRWETHSAPAMGERPQGIINSQVVRGCDMLIGCFWTRLGSPTGEEDSGTVEEIRYFLKNNKPVMLYFAAKQIDPNAINPKQLEKLNEFRSSIRDKGIQESYRSIDELREKLSRHLTIVMRGVSVDTSVPFKVVKEAKAATKSPAEDESGKGAEARAKSGEDVRLVDYTEKAFIVRGNTKAFKDQLKEARGKWMKTRDGDHAWMFSKRHIEAIAAILGVPSTLSDK